MSLVKQALILEFKELASKSIEYKTQLAGAKTIPKREMFKKKLKDNNIKAAELLSALEKLAMKEVQEAVGANDEVPSDEGRTETPI